MHAPTPISNSKAQFTQSESPHSLFSTEPGINTSHDEPATNQRSLSLGSLLDYGRTSQWLRQMVHHPDAYTTSLTRRPERSTRKQFPEPAETRASPVPSLENVKLARRITGMSAHSTRSDSKFDGFLFRKAVNDLEKVISEALVVASQAMERQSTNSPPTPCDTCSPLPEETEPLQDDSLPGSSTDSSSTVKKRPSFHSSEDISHDSDRLLCWHQRSDGSDSDTIRARKRKPLSQHVSFKMHQTGDDAHDSQETSPVPRTKRRPTGYVRPPPNLAGVGEQHIPYGISEEGLPERDIAGRKLRQEPGISLHKRSHVSLRGAQGINLARSRKRQPIARDWSPIRKRLVASVACTSTALIGVLLGIYAGLVPSIQYYIIDQSHVTVHGNTGCFLGLAIPTLLFWPLPLLHGRKPYILASLVLAMPLLFPQALAVNSQRLTDTISWRSMLLAARTLMGACLGFASMNFHSILTDLFGASLMSVNPHQEVVDHYDARRHGGGMGVWLGIWTWCWIGSLAIGFLIGAGIIDKYHPAWGFYVSIILIAIVLFLNVVCPEVRRSAYRRSVAEVRTGPDITRRIARGEVMMHRAKTGPRWWGEEVYHGLLLSFEMLRQPGFLVMCVYSGWIYAQVVLIIVLLGSLASRFYHFRSPEVGLLVAAVALGAFLAIPFQKANLFSRSRVQQLNSNKATLDKKVAWSSHMVRRTVFTILLPLAGMCYAAVSSGPPMHISLPTIFATCVGFLSCLAISECNGFIMEAFDCSDLSPGMTGRQRGSTARSPKKTNYSSFPRVTAGFALVHTFAFVFAAGASALGGHITRTLGQQVATGVVAGILFLLTLMLLLVLVRFVEVQIIPTSKFEEMEKLMEARRSSTIRRTSMPDDPDALQEEEKAWRPVMIGNPIGKTRRMNILELGSLTRWQEIRKKNKLIDSGAHAHLNRTAWNQGIGALDDQIQYMRSKRKGKRTYRSDEGSGTAESVDFSSYSMEDQAGPSRVRQAERNYALSQDHDERGPR